MTDYLKTVFFIAAFALLALDCQMNTAPTETLPAKLALGRRSARLSAADSIRSAQPPARTGDPQPVVHQMATGSLNTPDPIGRPRAAARVVHPLIVASSGTRRSARSTSSNAARRYSRRLLNCFGSRSRLLAEGLMLPNASIISAPSRGVTWATRKLAWCAARGVQ